MRNLLTILLLFLFAGTANAQLFPKKYGKLYDIGEAPKVVKIVNDYMALIETDSGATQFLLQQPTRKLREGKPLKNEVRYFQYSKRSVELERKLREVFKPITKDVLKAKFPNALLTRDANRRWRVLNVVSKDEETVTFQDPVSQVEHTRKLAELKSSELRYVKKWKPDSVVVEPKREPLAGDLVHGVKIQKVWLGKVVKISDGDTATVLTEDFQQVKVRLNGIDTPESKQAFGTKAKEALGEMIMGKQVSILDTGKDRYKRTLGFVRVDGVDVNAAMIQSGFAWHYKTYNSSPELAEFEREAREVKIGLWSGVGDQSPVPPWEFRKKE